MNQSGPQRFARRRCAWRSFAGVGLVSLGHAHDPLTGIAVRARGQRRQAMCLSPLGGAQVTTASSPSPSRAVTRRGLTFKGRESGSHSGPSAFATTFLCVATGSSKATSRTCRFSVGSRPFLHGTVFDPTRAPLGDRYPGACRQLQGHQPTCRTERSVVAGVGHSSRASRIGIQAGDDSQLDLRRNLHHLVDPRSCRELQSELPRLTSQGRPHL